MPLVKQNELSFNQILTQPIDIAGNKRHFMYIKSNHEYLAISKSKKYTTEKIKL